MDLSGIQAICLTCVLVVEKETRLKSTELCHLCSFRHRPEKMHSKGCCANCWTIEVGLSEWQDRCFAESAKPLEEQDERVFWGQF